MIKRIISVLLLTSILVSMFMFGSCSSEPTSDTFTLGQWLTLVNEFFGMESYTTEEPLFANVSKSDPYYDAVQIAAEWKIIDDEKIDVNKAITWKQTLLTLVNAGGFLAEDASDDDKIDFAISNFDSSIRDYWMDRKIEAEKAVKLLSVAQERWATQKYTNNISTKKYFDNVVELKSDSFEVDSKDSNTISIDTSAGAVKKDDILVLPDEENKFEKKYVKVSEVSNDGDKTVAKISEEVEIEDVYEEIYIEETVVPNAENAIMYDGNGNIIPLNSDYVPQSANGSSTVSTLAKGSSSITIDGKTFKNSHTFKVSGMDVKLGYNLDGKLDFSVSVSSGNLLSNSNGKDTLKFNAGMSVSDIDVTQKVDWKKKWGFIPVLNSATLKVDYKVKQNYSLEYAHERAFVAAPPYSNGNGKFLTNFKRAVMKDASGKVYGAETIASKKEFKICSLNIYSAGIAKICLDVRATISVNGSVTLTITENGSKGVEYKDGKLRFIKNSTKSYEAEAKAKIEATLGFGPALYLVGLKKRLVGIEVKVGIGASATLKMHLADSQMHLIEELDSNKDITPEQAGAIAGIAADISAKAEDIKAVAEAQGGIFEAEAGSEIKLHVDFCVNVNVYGILSIGVTDEGYLVDLLDSKKVKLSVSILNEKNATFLNLHVDNFKWSEAIISGLGDATKNHCTLNYVPFDKAEVEESSEEEISQNNENIQFGEKLTLSTMNVSMKVGEEHLLSISTLPQGYTANDIVYSSKDENVASVNSKGVITAKGEGCTIIYAKTKDEKYTALVAIIVETSSNVEFDGISI